MDPVSAFKNEVFRPIASIVLPGMLALGPFAVVLANAVAEVRSLYTSQPVVYFLLFVGASTIVGMLLENLGSSIERGIDRCMEVEYLPGVNAIWAAYLRMPCSDSYARKYLGSLITRLKFINSMLPAVYIFGFGLWALHLQLDRWQTQTMIVLSMGLFVLSAWLFRTSTELSEAAAFSRYQMLPPQPSPIIDTEAHSVSRLRHLAYVLVELRSSRVSEVDFSLLGRWQLMKRVLGIMIVAARPLNLAQPVR